IGRIAIANSTLSRVFGHLTTGALGDVWSKWGTARQFIFTNSQTTAYQRNPGCRHLWRFAAVQVENILVDPWVICKNMARRLTVEDPTGNWSLSVASRLKTEHFERRFLSAYEIVLSRNFNLYGVPSGIMLRRDLGNMVSFRAVRE
ncbi:hypothetical protein PFISCL1PPCAC_9333, partial [Pristionchus fissidentatus]